MDEKVIRELGIWTVRLALIGGAIYCAISGDKETAGTLAGVAIVSFLLLS